MATGAPGTNGVWQYGEDDSEATFSALLNKVASTTNTQIGADRTRLTALETTGRIIKTVSVSSSTAVNSTANSYVSTGLAASITPSSASNKILVMVTYEARNLSSTVASIHTIFRGTVAGTNLGSHTSSLPAFTQLYSVSGEIRTPLAMSVLDSPGTTSSVTYTAGFNPSAGNAIVMGENRKGTITLMEVVA